MRIENNSIGTNNYFGMKSNKYDPKEAAVAKKLGMSVEEFSQLPEEEKMEKVHEYNKNHPNDKIEDKGKQGQNSQGSEMNDFFNTVNWNNVKLE
jgi:DNA-directed RNA polymerase specialized sigma subunit